MTKRSTALTGAAGEHYVAYKLSAMGYAVAMTRGGSPTVDLMVGDLSGHAVSIQVKTSWHARREPVRSSVKNRWEWDVSHKAINIRSDTILYAFVDLKGNPDNTPDVFIVPSHVVADVVANMRPNEPRPMIWLRDAEAEQYREHWNFITDRLTQTEPMDIVPPGAAEPEGTDVT